MTEPRIRAVDPTALAPAQIADLLAASAATVVAELLALGDEGGWRPEPGEWSANECVGHLIEAERRGFAGRIRTILAGAAGRAGADARGVGPAGGRRGAPRPPPVRCGARRRVRRAPRRRASRSSAGCGRATSTASAIHPDVGPLRVDELLGEWVHHDRNHVRQMLAVSQARVWPQMGNARRFSLEDL